MNKFWEEWEANKRNVPVQVFDRTVWLSRSVAAVTLVFTKYDNQLCILANKRGKGTPDFQGYWNCPCGYLDYNETLDECAIREVYEETGVKLNSNELNLISIDSNPNSNRQNVTANFIAKIPYQRVTFSFKYAEEDEVEEIKLIPVSKINDYEWAFNHKELIEKARLYLSDFDTY